MTRLSVSSIATVLPSSGLLCALIPVAILPQFIPPLWPMQMQTLAGNPNFHLPVDGCGRDLDRHTPASEHHQGRGGGSSQSAEGFIPRNREPLRVLQAGCVRCLSDLSHFTEVPGPQLSLLGVCGEWKVSVQALQAASWSRVAASVVCSAYFSLGAVS